MSVGNRKTVLLVEDEAIIAMAEKASLEKYGYSVIAVPSGEKAFEALRGNAAVDLILMDIDLGRGIDGTETAKAILKGRAIPIVFLSSHVEPEVVAKTEKITSYGYVVKDSGPIVLDASIKMAFKLFEATDKLAKEKERLRTTLNSIGDAVIATDLDGNVTGMNPIAELLTAWTSDDAVGKPIGSVFNIVDAWTRLPAENPVEQVLTKGAIVALADQTVLISKSAVEYRIADSGAPIRSAEGTITGVVLVFRDVSGEYKMQAALRESEELYRSLFENILNGFAYCQIHYQGDQPVDFTYLSVNKAFESLTGLKDVAGRRVSEVIPGIRERDSKLLEIYGRVSQTGKPERFEIFVDSLRMWFWVSVYSPKRGYFVAVFDVITERKQAEEELRKQNAFMRTVLENAPIGFAVNTIDDGRAVFVSAKFREIYGVDRHAVNSVDEFFEKVYLDPVFREKMRARILSDMAGGDAARMRWENIPITTRTGEKKVVTAINIPVLEQNLMVSTVQDVTERWTAEERLRLSHERLRRFVDANIIGIVIAAADGKIVETNDYYLNLIGYTRREFEAGLIDWRAITPPEWLPADENSIRELHEMGTCTPYEKEYQLRDGSRVSVFITNALLPGPEEHIAAFVLDVTERKRAEERIKRLLEEKELALRSVQRRKKSNEHH